MRTSFPRTGLFAKAFREVFPYSLHSFVSQFFKGIITGSDIWIINQFVPTAYVGLYAYAKSFANIPTVIIPIVTPVVLPVLSRAFEKRDYAVFKKILKKSSFYLGMLAMAIALFLMTIIPFLFGMEDENGKNKLE